MEWRETEEIAIARAKLRNRIENRILNIPLSIVIGLIISGLILAVVFIKFGGYRQRIWEPFFIVTIIIIFSVLLHLYNYWSRHYRPLRKSILLDNQSFTIKYEPTFRFKGGTKTIKYDDFVGFSISDKPNGPPNPLIDEVQFNGKLLVFGNRDGENISIGIPPGMPVNDVRTFLSGKLSELSDEEMPKSRNPFKR
jgi:hypothetical protein